MKNPLKLNSDNLKKISSYVITAVKSLQLILISAVAVTLLGYAILEVGQIASSDITPEQEAQKQAELASKKIDFAEATILEIQSRLDEDIDVQAQDLGTDNPFQFNN